MNSDYLTAKEPLITIGMPVFNGAATLAAAIESILGQNFSDFEFIISNNCSADETDKICRQYAAKDPRIRYFSQTLNLGAEPNFAFVLEKAAGKYFMWAAADDVRSLDFIQLNCEFLENYPDYVCSVSPVKFEGRSFNERQMGDRSLDDERFDRRLRKFFGAWHANGAFYSLMRTHVIRKCPWIGQKFLGADWVIVLYLAQQGKLKRLEQGWLKLGTKGGSNSNGTFRSYRTNLFDLVAPFLTMSHAALSLSKDAPFSSRAVIFWECLKMNLWALKLQFLRWLYRLYGLIRAKFRYLIRGGLSSCL